ncbi:hypothetical protein [Nocardia sp. CA-119907]|uniref:hypothetical protein n=1 Tax=Nocardia sp. CA-119907 TaxID=3239973 RepID=UPI003D95C61E
MRATSNQFFGSALAALFGSLVMTSGPVAMAQPPSTDPTPECQAGESQSQGPYYCVCGDDGQWVCHVQDR